MNESRNADRLPDELPADPMHWADAWIKEATAAGLQRHGNAMTLITVGAEGRPSSRIVLCKEFVPDPGYLVFYTNYLSRKSQEISANSHVAAQFHWDAIGRQIRIEGIAVRSPDPESDGYFATRDRGSQLGAWGSDQSAEIESREGLIAQVRQRAGELGLPLADDDSTLPADDQPPLARPAHWGGFRVWAVAIELWMEGGDRIHDRALWTRQIVRASEHQFTTSPWTGNRLQP